MKYFGLAMKGVFCRQHNYTIRTGFGNRLEEGYWS